MRIEPQPNDLQMVKLANMVPSSENVRLFIERESLDELVALYRAYGAGEDVLLPDPPILRLISARSPLEIIAGERRVTAARIAKLNEMPCRVTLMTDEAAYRFIVHHNHVAGLTTAEMAVRAAEMDRLCFTEDEISKALRGASVYRYVEVGKLINQDWFTSDHKLCDPSIVEWYEAAQFGAAHFARCFQAWNAGLWDADRCAKEFRMRGKVLPLDNSERGIRVTYNDNRLVLRGQINLDYIDEKDAEVMIDEVIGLLRTAKSVLKNDASFGPRMITQVNPTTISS